MASESPYAKTKHVLTEDGWTVGRTEHWNAFANIRQDLFGFADMVAIKPGEPITAIQVTSASNHSTRRVKILNNECARVWCAAGGRILVWSWLKKRGHWGQRVEVALAGGAYSGALAFTSVSVTAVCDSQQNARPSLREATTARSAARSPSRHRRTRTAVTSLATRS
jgi:hypothetical protein